MLKLFQLDQQIFLENFCQILREIKEQAQQNQTLVMKKLESGNSLCWNLRGGGGCIWGSKSQIHNSEKQSQRKLQLPQNFASNLEKYSESINQNSKQLLDNDNREELLIAIQWFIYNKYYINQLVKDECKAIQYQEKIIVSIEKIIQTIPTFVKASCFLCHEVLQILNDLLRFLFIRKSKFEVESNLQDKLLHQIISAESQIQGSLIQIWETGIKFELQVAKLALENLQTRDGQEIAGKYLFNQAQAKIAEKQYEFYFFFEQLKWNIIESLQEGNTNTILLQIKLSKAYEDYILNSKNWMPHFCWVKMLSDLISYRPLVHKKDLFKDFQEEKQNQQWKIERNSEFIRVSSYDQNFGTVIFNKQEFKDIYINFRKIEQFQQFLMLEYGLNQEQQTFKTLLDYVKLTLQQDEKECDDRDLVNFLLFENPNLDFLKSNMNYLNYLNDQNKDLVTKILWENNDYEKKPLELINQNLFKITIIIQEIFIQIRLYQKQIYLASKIIQVVPIQNKNEQQELNQLFNQTQSQNFCRLQCEIIMRNSTTTETLKKEIQDANQYYTKFIQNLKKHIAVLVNYEKELIQKQDQQESVTTLIKNISEFPTMLKEIFNFQIYQQFITIICEQHNKLIVTENQKEILSQQVKLLQLLQNVIQQIQKKYSKMNKWIQTMNDDENTLLQLIDQKKQQQIIEQIQMIQSYFRQELEEIKSLKLSSREFLDQSKKDELKTLIQKNKEKIKKNNLNHNQNKIYFLTASKIQIILSQIKSQADIKKLDDIIQMYEKSIQQNQTQMSLILRSKTTIDGRQNLQKYIINFTKNETLMNQFMDGIKNHIENLQNFYDYLNVKDNNDDELIFQEYMKKTVKNFQAEFIDNITKLECYELNQNDNSSLEYQFRQVANFFQTVAISLNFKYSDLEFRNPQKNARDRSSDYRVRECLFFSVMKIQNIIKEPQVIQFCQLIIQQLWMVEKNENVRNIFKDKEMIEEQKKLYSHELHTFTQKVQQEFKAKLYELKKLESEIRQEGLQSDKIELTLKLQEKYSEFQENLNNINEMTQQVNLSFVFLTEIHKDLQNLQRKIDKIQTGVDNILTDVRQLRGKSYKELLIMRRNKVLHEQSIANMNSIYIKLKTNRRTYSSNNNKYHQDKYDAKIHFLLQEEDDENGNEVKQADVNLFLDFDKKSDVMLIRGQAGSGKSRAAKKIEEFIWKRHQRNQQDWIPIFISLPSLKDPIKNLFNEAMESDYYHFDRIQIRELKDAISNNRERVVLILDSYDELKNDIKSKNLYQTNDLAQQFNIKPEDNKNLKIIITTRSELLQDKNFASWFVGSDIKAFIDIELQQFSEKEIKEYLDKYSHLSVKNKIYGLYEYVQQIEGKKVDPEDVKLIQSKISPFIKKQSIDNIEVDKKQILLNGHKVKNILDNIKLLPYFKNLRDEQIIKLEKELLELWSQEKYQDSIDNLNISNILQTPYMMEIVVQVLPNFAKIYSEVAQIKELFKKNYLAIKESEKNSKLIIEKYKSKIRNQQQRYINNYNDEPDQQYNKLLKIMEEIKFFQNFSILNNLNQINTYPGLEADDKNAIISSYRQKIFTTYEFYENFINFYHAQQMIKQQRLGNVSNFEALRIDLWVYAESLALEMTLNDQTYFTHQISGLLKLEKLQEIKKPEKNWLDQYFDGTEKEQEYKNLIRSCILLTCKGNVYSFTHKSIQEFFAAKYVINLFQDFFENKKYTNEEIQKSIYNNDKFNISKANFQKISEFIINYFKGREQVFVNQLIEILKLSQKEDFLVRSASNSLFLLSQFKAFLGGQSLQNLKISDTKINGLSFFNSNLSRSIFENVEIDGCNFNLAKIEDVIWKIICKEQRTLSEHKQKVTALTMSLDGKRLYSGSIQGEIICWDYAQRKKQHIKQHNDQINCLIISPDGQLLASTGKKNTITLWNSITLEIIKLLEEHTDEVNSINFLQDKNEKLLASGSSDQTILLWNYDKMQRIKQPLKHKTKVMQLVIFPNSKQLASRCLDNCIRIWNINIEFPQIIQIFLNQSFELRSIGISADGQNLIAGYKYQQEQQDEVCVGVWVLRQESCRRELEIQKSKKIFSLAIFLQSEQLSTNKKTIIIAGSQNVIIFWQENLNENELIQKGSVEALAFSKDQKLLISASEIEIKLWNCYNDFTLNKLIDLNLDSILNSPIKKLALIDNNLIFWTQNKNIYYIQQNENQDVLTINCDGDVQEIEFGQSYIICGGNDEAIQIYKYYQSNFTNYDILENYSDERNPSKGINFLALSLDEQFLASADKNQMIYLFTITDRLWSLFHQFDTQKIVTSLSFIPTKNLLAFGCDDKTLILWDKDEKTIIDQFAGHSGQISMINSSSDGSLLIYKIYNEESQEQIGVLSFQNSQKQFKGIKSDVIQIVTSPNDEKFLGIGEDQQIQIWDLQSEKIKPSPITKKVDLTCALINQENNLITGQNNGDIIIWQMINEDENKFADGQLAQFGHSENINSLCFSPDGLNLVSSSEDKILVWDIQKNKKIEQINQSALQVMYFPNYPEKQLLLIRQQKKILIWNIIQREELRFQITDKVITAIDIIEESQQVVYGLDDGNILIWNNNGQDQPQKLEKKHDQKVNSISSKFDGSFLVLGSNDCKISIWKKDQHQLYEFVEFKEVHKNKVKVVIFTPDGQYLASGDSEGIIYIWVTDAYYEQEIHTEQYNCEIITMAFSQDGKILATGYNDKCIKIWKTEELILIQTIQRENENVFSISFSIDDKLAYSFGSDINLCANYLDINQNAQYIAYQTYTKYPILQAEKCQIKNCKIDDATDQNQSLLELFLQKKAIKEE